ncbi:VasL domain-containing protein, partial [Klebsiella pneumoniae]
AQLKRLNDLPPLWPLRQEEALLLALERRWPNNSQIKAMSAEWRKQREASALPVPDLQRYAQAQAKLRQLSLRLDALDERKGRYMTASE